MPAPEEIVAGLSAIAQRAFPIAVVFHVLLALCAAAWLAGLRPRPRTIAILLSVPIASVAAIAFWFKNPFNGGIFAVLALVLLLLARRSVVRSERIPASSLPLRALGVVLVLFALVYPHFLHDRSPLAYLYGAPLALIPCPTLGFATGIALTGIARADRAWSALLASASICYALFGVLRLGVTLDLVLFAGAIGLLVLPWRERPR